MRRACVIGWPVEHSRSPLIHRYWLKQYGIDGAYEKEAVRPEALARFLALARRPRLCRRQCHACRTRRPPSGLPRWPTRRRARSGPQTRCGSMRRRLCAGNTDAYGLHHQSRQAAPGWNEGRRPAVVLGAGGAARAIVHGLSAEGGHARFSLPTARAAGPKRWRKPSARRRGDRWQRPQRALVGLRSSRQHHEPRHDGQGPARHRSAALPEDAVVADIVYVPLETPLLAAAGRRGNRRSTALACCCIRRRRHSRNGSA